MAKSSLQQEDAWEGVSPLTKRMFETLVGANQKRPASKKKGPPVVLLDPNSTNKEELEQGPKGLSKSFVNFLNNQDSISRLAFEEDPTQNNTYASVYKNKLRLIPDSILKRLAIQDSLVAAIVNTRAAQLQSFGRPQPDRFSVGFKLVPDEQFVDKLNEEDRKRFDNRVAEIERLLVTCGPTKGWSDPDKTTFSQWLGVSARNAVTVGRIATELVYAQENGKKKFMGFRAIDAGTIYKAAPQQTEAEAVRKQALQLLQDLKPKGVKLEPERFTKDEYAYVQVIEGRPVQAFTAEECVVHTFYPVSDVELDGYPVTPLDTVMADVTTHINITTHNKNYFQSGRGARGILVIKSEDISDDTISTIKHTFNATVNSVQNAFRTPVFGIGATDEMQWLSVETGGRDMEFQYLSDTTARVIMSAFQMSPEELPGYQHLSRGTNNQALSESNNEWKMEAARDVGIRPLIAQFEDFLNARILPLLDEQLAKVCVIKFLGLDAETPEKEGIGLERDQTLHYTYDEILQKVEKKPVGLDYGGQLPLNPLFLQNLDKYFTVGQILERFMGKKDASKDPSLAYFRDPFWFQWQQLQMQAQQMQMQQQQMQMQAAGGAPQDPNAPQQQPQGQPPAEEGGDLSTGLDQVIGLLNKSEAQLPPSRRRLLQQQRKTVDAFLKGMDRDLEEITGKILEVAEDFAPAPKKKE